MIYTKTAFKTSSNILRKYGTHDFKSYRATPNDVNQYAVIKSVGQFYSIKR